MRYLIYLVMLTILISSSAAFVSRVYPEEIKSGSRANVVVTIYNPERTRLRDASLTAYIPYLEVRDVTSVSRIRSRQAARVYLEMDLPEAKPGYYPMILILQDDEIRERTHTWIYIS